MKSIWKFPIKPLQEQGIDLPKNSLILSAQWQESAGEVCLWALCDPNESAIERHVIRTIATGEMIPDDESLGLVYLATVQVPPALVFHLFRKPFADPVVVGDHH